MASEWKRGENASAVEKIQSPNATRKLKAEMGDSGPSKRGKNGHCHSSKGRYTNDLEKIH